MSELGPVITASLRMLGGKKRRHLVLGRSGQQRMDGENPPTGEPRLV